MTVGSAQAIRRAGVIGSPIAHSLSPVLHRAAYEALGLTQWDYQRFEVGAGGVADFVATLDRRWAGLSVTMPGKEEALTLAAGVSERARLSGAANTLVQTSTGWRADNTDIDGITMALGEAGCRHATTAWVVGSGATARSALIALAGLGVSDLYLQVRAQPRQQTLTLAKHLGMGVEVRGFADPGPPVTSVDVAISTVPAGTAPEHSNSFPRHAQGLDRPLRNTALIALDVAYHPRTSRWAQALASQGARRVDGATMLLHQAGAQVELMTGKPPPVESMRRALSAALQSAGDNPW
ncbi:MAG: shikimate dehydrogenase [Ornithinimicrobium sp.]